MENHVPGPLLDARVLVPQGSYLVVGEPPLTDLQLKAQKRKACVAFLSGAILGAWATVVAVLVTL